MKKKLLAGLMTFVVLFSNNLCIAKAEEVQGEALTAETFDEISFNVMEKSYSGPDYVIDCQRV